MKLFYDDVSSPRKRFLIKVIEAKVPDKYIKVNWKLLKIKEVPLPELGFPASLGMYEVKKNPLA
ncbi:MAG: hypothetical protein KME08_11950 [Aphanothece sp. CMT-3BRIN-NPC111]|jgi:hypothetical protein|nr:hypothetical protein [Aphanothece sp. CMT-3BRIN-NPC111]